MERFTKKEKERFDSKWIERGGCWIWQSPLDVDGYGSFYFKRKNRRAHRVSYYFSMGDIPSGMVVDHTCPNRNCVNPSHMRIVTPRENTLSGRGVGAVNARKTHCKYGHPLDRKYGNQRYCSICSAEKSRRLHKKWRDEDTISC